MKKLILAFFASLLIFVSCSARIDGVVLEGGAAEFRFSTALKPRTTAIIRSLQAFTGAPANAPLLDGTAIAQSMADAPGLSSISIRNTAPAALEGTVSVSNIGDFLAETGAEGRFITFTEGRTPGSSSIIITLDRYSAPAIISRLSPEVVQYLSALMAPAALGEASTRQEYLNLLAMVYGRQMADEVAAGRIVASIEFPRPVTEVRGGHPVGRRAEFSIPLLDILVLEQPLRYEVRW